jgi:hypothetical protein
MDCAVARSARRQERAGRGRCGRRSDLVFSDFKHPQAVRAVVARSESAIPVGTQFSPDLVDLSGFLNAIISHSGNKPAMQAAIWQANVRVSPPKSPPTRRQSSLPLEAAVRYGLLDDRYVATELARSLAKLNGQELYDAFARHVLLRCGGLRVVEAAQQMAADEPSTGIAITGDTLAAYLTDQGFRVTVHNTAINSMRLWLARAGVFSERGWDVNPGAKERLLGLSDKEIGDTISLGEDQRAILLAICRVRPSGEYPASLIRENSERDLGRRLDRGSLPKLLGPLKDAGFIDFRSGGTKGGKTAVLWTLPRFDGEVLEPFLKDAAGQLDAVASAYFSQDWTEIHRELDSTNAYVKGRALEAYSVQLMRRLGLRFVKWRERAREHTGQAEVDVILSGTVGGSPTRWQVQCKNTPLSRVDLADVAKEVGLLPLTKATHILMLARCPFTKDARTFAKEVMRNHPVTIYLLDDKDFESIRSSHGGTLASILQAKAHEAAALPRHGLDWLGGQNR